MKKLISVSVPFYLFFGVCVADSATPAPKSIGSIDTMRQASLLKLHFMSRGETPKEQLQTDWEQLTIASRSTPPSTKRWFWLQNVRAFAAYRLPFVNPAEGAAAYSALFDRAEQAPQVKAEDVVRISLNEYLFSLTTKFSSLKQQHTLETGTATIKAWQAYLASQQYSDPAAAESPRLHWISTFNEVPAPNGFRKVLEKQLKGTKSPSYDLLTVSAFVLGNDNPKRAIALQLRAKPLLPQLADGQLDYTEASDYYSHLIGYYREANQLDEAVRVAREQISKTGKGYSSLIQALKATKKSTEEQKKVLDTLALPSAPEGEVIQVSDFLSDRAINKSDDGSLIGDKTSADQLVVLLQAFLNTKRLRSPEAELTARLHLGQVLLAQNRFTDAQKVVDDSKIIIATTYTAHELQQSIDKLGQRIARQQQVVPVQVPKVVG